VISSPLAVSKIRTDSVAILSVSEAPLAFAANGWSLRDRQTLRPRPQADRPLGRDVRDRHPWPRRRL